MRIHTGAKPFECPICKECFRTSGHRKNHMTQAHQEQQTEIIKSEQAPLERIVTENTVVALPTLPSTQSSLSILSSSLRDAIASVSSKSMLGETVRYVCLNFRAEILKLKNVINFKSKYKHSFKKQKKIQNFQKVNKLSKCKQIIKM